MIELTLGEIAQAVGGTIVSGDEMLVIRSVSTDSRTIERDGLFIPLQGPTFDGHNYIQEAFCKGVNAVFTEKEPMVIQDKGVIAVGSTLQAMQTLANYILKKANIPVIAITGSYGKTSTKDMIAGVLEQKFNVLKTQGNFNNDVGVPLTIFQLEKEHQVAVIEMGMSALGEIRRLSKIAEPEIAVITNIGVSHIEDVGSQDNILKAKSEIIDGLKQKGLLLLNADDEYLTRIQPNNDFVMQTIAMNKSADFTAVNIRQEGMQGVRFEVMISSQRTEFHIPVPGQHQVYNAMMAIAVGIKLGLSITQIQEGIQMFSPSKMRQTIMQCHGVRIINDAYNASPQTMISSIQVLKQVAENGRKIAVLGDMYSLGEMAESFHYEIGKYVAQEQVDILITIGSFAKQYTKGAQDYGMQECQMHVAEDHQQAIRLVRALMKQGDAILVKASRSMKLEKIVEGIEKIEEILE